MIVSIIPTENLAKIQGGSTTTSDPHWLRKRQCCIAALLLTSVEDVCKILFVVGIVRTIGWERISHVWHVTRCHKLSCCLRFHFHVVLCCLMWFNHFDSTTYSSRGCFIRGGIAFDFMIWRPSSLHSAVAFSSIAHETKSLRGKNPIFFADFVG